jgi:hypothetical protein
MAINDNRSKYSKNVITDVSLLQVDVKQTLRYDAAPNDQRMIDNCLSVQLHKKDKPTADAGTQFRVLFCSPSEHTFDIPQTRIYTEMEQLQRNSPMLHFFQN